MFIFWKHSDAFIRLQPVKPFSPLTDWTVMIAKRQVCVCESVCVGTLVESRENMVKLKDAGS